MYIKLSNSQWQNLNIVKIAGEPQDIDGIKKRLAQTENQIKKMQMDLITQQQSLEQLKTNIKKMTDYRFSLDQKLKKLIYPNSNTQDKDDSGNSDMWKSIGKQNDKLDQYMKQNP